jgi:nicotinate dehydrogenase subunit A
MVLTLNVNGRWYPVECAADTPLLLVLRNDLGLVGSRPGCGAGYCGACMVLLDGQPATSCDLSVEAASGREVVTIEGLISAGRAHALQQAFIEFQAAQCGWCSTGMIVTGAALLDRTPTPDRSEIVEALKDNLCRCGVHNRILRAIAAAADAGAGP